MGASVANFQPLDEPSVSRAPLVSIGLPTMDSRRFLTERIESITRQTLQDWELVVIDGQSVDGTFETLQDLAARDPRVRVYQEPRDGIYPNFNRCAERALGKYVYIATSDDTMADNCLEKLVEALERNPDCDIAHCPMRVIGEDGTDGVDWWSGQSLFARSSGEWLSRPHKRAAPLDGLLCLLGDNVYSSVTQLLIRRELFEKIGYYRADWGSVGDFHWNLRAGLVASTVHVPDTWASWRMHDGQATAAARLGSAAHQEKIDGMIRDALAGPAGEGLPARLVAKAEALRNFLRAFDACPGPLARKVFAVKQALAGSGPAWQYFSSFLTGRRWPRCAPETVGNWMEAAITPLDSNDRG